LSIFEKAKQVAKKEIVNTPQKQSGGRKVFVNTSGSDLPDAPKWIRYKQELEILHLLEDRVNALHTMRALVNAKNNWSEMITFLKAKRFKFVRDDMDYALGNVAGAIDALTKCMNDLSIILSNADWSKVGPYEQDSD
jgi:hypothetical protein